MSDLRAELVQVAAVAVAWIENIDNGHTDPLAELDTEMVLADVADERLAQENKWGQRNMEPTHWLPILMEEVGEVAEAMLGHLDWSNVKVEGADDAQ